MASASRKSRGSAAAREGARLVDAPASRNMLIRAPPTDPAMLLGQWGYMEFHLPRWVKLALTRGASFVYGPRARTLSSNLVRWGIEQN